MKYFVFALLLTLFFDVRSQKSETFVMPMNIKPEVSGSFAELRTNHFHSGIDLSTVGRIGVPVYSVMDGFVSRIKVSSGGYGKALYIEHPNGMTSVYAHLSAYSARIDSLVRISQYEKESFEVEIHLNPNQLRIGAGELVALSGNSGSSGGPHLHFELRDTQTQDPLEPMANLSYVKDNVPPVIYGIKIYPLSLTSKVGQGRDAFYYPVVAGAKGYVLKDRQSVTAAGTIGFGVHVIDLLTDNHRRCGVSDIRLYCDNELLYHSSQERISFAKTRYINSYIDYAERMNNNRFIQKSFVDPNNRLDCYLKNETLEVKPGEVKNMRYEIRDARGNLSVAEFVVKGVEPFQSEKPTALSANEHKVPWRRGLTYDADGLSLFIAPESVYRDEILVISKGVVGEETVYRVGNHDIPIHEPFELSIALPERMKADPAKAYIAYIDSKNKPNFMGGSILNDRIIVKSRQFGRFVVRSDNKAPLVSLKQVQGSDYRKRRFIDVTIKDDESGIASYRCEIDGKWQLFEYDYKTSTLRGDLKLMGLPKDMTHELVVSVKDARGNEKIQKYSFIY